MKQVYLVYATLFYHDGNCSKFVINAFLSFSKAVNYADYKRFCIERDGAAHVFGSFVDFAIISFDSESICTYDWPDDLKQCERFEAIRLAEEKRNFELTEKYNLLEFV